MLLSGGDLVLSDTSPTFARTTYWQPAGVGLQDQFSTYAAVYRAQLWVNTLVNKLAFGVARLPLPVYHRTDSGREAARDTPYAQIIRRPNPKHDPFFFWLWTASTFFVYGEALWVKIRQGRQVKELWPIHPANIITRNEEGTLVYYFYGGSSAAAAVDPILRIPAEDIVHFRTYNPDTTVRGVSPIEPLRQTLLNEDASRRAITAFWKNGARPSMYLSHPNQISKPAADRLKAQWDGAHGGADNFGKTAILEEGMQPHTLSLSAEESQYIAARQLNREEACAVYDVPPPAVHILDHATFSNITEQLRSLYRDTMAPKLGLFESTLDYQLRPDFGGDDLYAEFLMEEVLRGAFEQRAQSYQQAINSGWLKPGEARVLENLPPAEGADRLFVNSTLIPIDEVSSRTSPNAPAYDEEVPIDPAVTAEGTGSTSPSTATPSPATAGVAAQPKKPVPKRFDRRTVAKAAGRAAGRESLAEIDPDVLTSGMNGDAKAVAGLLEESKAAGDDVATFCALLWALAKPEETV